MVNKKSELVVANDDKEETWDNHISWCAFLTESECESYLGALESVISYLRTGCVDDNLADEECLRATYLSEILSLMSKISIKLSIYKEGK